MVANFTAEKQTIPKATIFGVAEKVCEPKLNKINAGSEVDMSRPENPRRKKKETRCNTTNYYEVN